MGTNTSKPFTLIVLFCIFASNLAKEDDKFIFECPESVDKSKNDFDEYWKVYHEMNEANLKDLTNFRDKKYAQRGHTYTTMKSKTTRYKQKFFGDNLKSGDTIYESACGEGFNLFMTLEILKEERNIVNLTTYGNDYLQDSIDVANRLFDQEAGDWFRKGKLCQGDSSNLSFVPSNSFDLVYTGFIDPLIDPLKLLPELASFDEKEEASKSRCRSKKSNERALSRKEQLAQEDWFASWTKELIRIAKPGKAVIIEDVGYSLCDSTHTEWGGVDMEWWEDAIDDYDFDVIPDSLRIINRAWYGDRYNVFFRKLGGDLIGIAEKEL
jgi:SAM-dependent methyltransferase